MMYPFRARDGRDKSTVSPGRMEGILPRPGDQEHELEIIVRSVTPSELRVIYKALGSDNVR